MVSWAPCSYRIGSSDYAIGDNHENLLPSNIASHQTSELARCAVHDALRLNGFGGRKVRVVVTLPVGRFAREVGDSAVDIELIEAKKQTIIGDISSAAGVDLAEIEEVLVAPESIPAFMDYATDNDGNFTNGFDGSSKVVTVDIGGTTTDAAVFEGRGVINETHSITDGVLSMVPDLKAGIMAVIGGNDVRHQLIEKVIRGEKIKGHDFSELLATSRLKTWHRIQTRLEQIVPDPDQFDLVLAIGGGAKVFEKELREWSKSLVIPKDPVSSVARGLLKINGL